MNTGMIFNIQKCSIHDGKGMRTTVFFKGCGLHCLWCANPESIQLSPELSYNEKVCIACGMCTKRCPNQAIESQSSDLGIFHKQDVPEKKTNMIFHRELCINCGQCVDVCCMEARHLYGKQVSVDELFTQIYKDRYYYAHSAGGVTFSGGEVLLQWAFLRDICKKCKAYNINTAIETCGFADYEKFKEALPYIDFIYFDLKHMNSEAHKKITGQGNEKILSNLKRIDDWGIEIHVRTPVVPGYNDDNENIKKTAEFIAELKHVTKYELLAYHQFGISKYYGLGKSYPLKDVKAPSDQRMMEIKNLANEILQPVGKICIYNNDNSEE